jgi:hypothetical protein
MSLINDALKKAQKQRTGESTPLAAMPGVGGESAARIAKRAKPVGFNSQLIRLGLGAGAVLVLIIGGWLVMRKSPAKKPEPSAVSGQQSAAQTPPAVPTTENREPRTEPAVSKLEPSSGVGGPANAFVLPIVTPPPPTPEPVVVKKSETKPVPSSPAAQRPDEPAIAQRATAGAPAQPALPPAKLEPKAITYIENLHIAGIRASATDSKVLMNDRVYRVGDIVEHEMNLKLIGITANSLTFEDERGSRYTRQF